MCLYVLLWYVSWNHGWPNLSQVFLGVFVWWVTLYPHFCSAISSPQHFREGIQILLTRDDSRLNLNDSSEYSTCQLDSNARGHSGHVVVLPCWCSAHPWESPWCPQIPWYSRFELSHICTPSIQQETGIAQWHLRLTFGYLCTPGELDCAMCRTAPKHRIWCLLLSCYQLFNYVWKPIKTVNIEFPSGLCVKPAWKFYVVSHRLSSILKIHPQQSSATRNRDS